MPQPLSHPAEPPPALALPAGALTDLPLRGLTLLAVEDSRFACEALRLICQRTGARLRRAETLAAARAHLRTYRPDIALVDLGLPDGSGLSLIADLALSCHRPEAVVAISGDSTAREAAQDAGADAFVEKPVTSITGFLALLRRLMPGRIGPHPPLRDDAILPDPLALQDDLGRAAALLAGNAAGGYVAGFVRGLAGQMQDPPLEEAARQARRGDPAGLAALRGLVGHRIAAPPGLFGPRRGN